jgi:ABC-type multidrug transport system fused ATPase/permease subunit
MAEDQTPEIAIEVDAEFAMPHADQSASSTSSSSSMSMTTSTFDNRVVAPMRREAHEASMVEAEKDEYFGGNSAVDASAVISDRNEHPIIILHNVHKTYLLGVEGVPALRYGRDDDDDLDDDLDDDDLDDDLDDDDLDDDLDDDDDDDLSLTERGWTSGVSLTIRRGEFICIFGTSGGGKVLLCVWHAIDWVGLITMHCCVLDDAVECIGYD